MTLQLWPALIAAVLLLSRGSDSSDQAAVHHRAGVELHLARSLDEAAVEYDAALRLDPPLEPSAGERDTILRLVPRIVVNAREPFALKDVAAILHPTNRTIAYHFFWDDDIDFPDDNDPSDHEVAWISYNASGSITRVTTLFHGRLVDGGEPALADARRHRGRAEVSVQWGKHGLMPDGWRSLTVDTEQSDEDTNIPAGQTITMLEYNRLTWEKLTTEGTRGQTHPLAIRHGWPSRFAGDFAAFSTLTREIDVRRLLKPRSMMLVSRWNSATLARCLLLYNFRPKLEWPEEFGAL